LVTAASVFGFVLLRWFVQVRSWPQPPPSPMPPNHTRPMAEAVASPESHSPPPERSGNGAATSLSSALPTLAVCLVIIGLGLAIRVEVPYHEVFKPHSLKQFVVFLGQCLAWPWIVVPPFTIFNLFPLMLLAWVYWRDKRARTPAEELVLAIGLWVVVQALAMAYARGGRNYPQWRYMDSLCFITVAGALSLALLATRHQDQLPLRRYFWPCAGLWILASIVGVVLLCDRVWRIDIPLRVMHQRMQLLTTRAYLATGERKYLETREKEYLIRWATPNEPPDDAAAAIRMLTRPHIRELLPACARDPLPVLPANVTGFSTNVPVPARPAVPGEVAWSSYAPSGVGPAGTGHFESQAIPAPKLGWLEFRVAGDLGQPGLSLKLIELKSGRTTQIKPCQPPGASWQSYQVRAPAEEFKLIASDENRAGWFAFQPPREVGGLSWLSARLTESGQWLFFAGLAVYAAAIALTLADRQRRAGMSNCPAPPISQSAG
jgi:hypothetical protein